MGLRLYVDVKYLSRWKNNISKNGKLFPVLFNINLIKYPGHEKIEMYAILFSHEILFFIIIFKLIFASLFSVRYINLLTFLNAGGSIPVYWAFEHGWRYFTLIKNKIKFI